MVASEKRKRQWQRNAEEHHNHHREDAPWQVVTRETLKAGIFHKSPIWQGKAVKSFSRMKVDTLEQLKRGWSQAAEGKKDELPEHFYARWPAEDATETIESAKPVWQQNEAKKVGWCKVGPCQSVESIQILCQAHSKAPVEVQTASKKLVPMRKFWSWPCCETESLKKRKQSNQQKRLIE